MKIYTEVKAIIRSLNKKMITTTDRIPNEAMIKNIRNAGKKDSYPVFGRRQKAFGYLRRDSSTRLVERFQQCVDIVHFQITEEM